MLEVPWLGTRETEDQCALVIGNGHIADGRMPVLSGVSLEGKGGSGTLHTPGLEFPFTRIPLFLALLPIGLCP
jgi:hypothetical protein